MKNITLRVTDELHAQIQEMSEEINCSAHSMILFLIKLGMKVYAADATIHLTDRKPQSARSSSRKSE